MSPCSSCCSWSAAFRDEGVAGWGRAKGAAGPLGAALRVDRPPLALAGAGAAHQRVGVQGQDGAVDQLAVEAVRELPDDRGGLALGVGCAGALDPEAVLTLG